ncbi:Basic helix-loop-helix DNA-binding superfamily protein, putative isoform 1 [Hibiscus syriacus]|uniref:Basic helix-loop-helix DNA-binding superfamily protein, putative isoform 1 n=1 Tax=Hibiscus syriacus TaxID=106335 RepID=A0A6A3BK54_HIBSY|nr:Basic helix-loop-helix DNA-binding superfamily protein, putative isoform 1 [Hibiscus syriacus]
MKLDEDIKTMSNRFTSIINELKNFGKIYLNEEMVRKLLTSLPTSWEGKTTAIEEAKDLELYTLDELIGSLLTHEEPFLDKLIQPTLREKVFHCKRKLTPRLDPTPISSLAICRPQQKIKPTSSSPHADSLVARCSPHAVRNDGAVRPVGRPIFNSMKIGSGGLVEEAVKRMEFEEEASLGFIGRVGKITLANEICRDNQVRSYFNDRILFLTISQSSDIQQLRARIWGFLIGNEAMGYTNNLFVSAEVDHELWKNEGKSRVSAVNGGGGELQRRGGGWWAAFFMKLAVSKWVFAFSLFCWLIFSVGFSVDGVHGESKVTEVNLGGWLVIEGWIKPSLFDGIPNGDMLDGTQVQFKSETLQKYVSAENGGGMDISVNRDEASSWETFTLWRVSESEFQFRTAQGQFLTCYGNGCSVSATAKSASSTETFKIERNNNGKVHIKIKSGTYFQATIDNQLTADYPGTPGWDDNAATFEMSVVANNLHGDYQLAKGYGHNKAKQVLEKHINSFLNVGDFDFLYRHGINTVRIPVGWWIAYDPDPPAPFIGGTAYSIKCIIDLYAAPGSQNGMEHSASQDGTTVCETSLLVGDRTIKRTLCCRSSVGYINPLELYQADIGSHNLVVELHYYNLFDTFLVNSSAIDNIEFILKSRESQPQALNGVNGPLIFIGEWVNEWNVASASESDYQEFGREQLEVYNAASFGWAYWTLKNDRKHWEFEWNIGNNYLQLSNSENKKIPSSLLWLVVASIWFHYRFQ